MKHKQVYANSLELLIYLDFKIAVGNHILYFCVWQIQTNLSAQWCYAMM